MNTSTARYAPAAKLPSKRKARTPLSERKLPDYTLGEEIVNTSSHVAGALFGVLALVSCVLTASARGNIWGIVSGAVYGATLILLYAMSSVYHGLPKNTGKKVMQVIDHCTIFFLISGTYTPVVLCSIREYSPAWGWTIFGVVWGCAVLGAVLNAIDLKKYAVFSMICYLGMGWCIIAAAKVAFASVPFPALMWILAGGIAYTVGAVMYGLGRTHRYMHSVFHIFVLIGSVTQYVGIVLYIM